jgi:hypothetical protein
MASQTFMEKRNRIWFIQFTLIMTVIVLEFPMNALNLLVNQSDASDKGTELWLASI